MEIPQLVDYKIRINAPISKVWEALTNPALMKLWMSDFEMQISTNWEVGSEILVSGDLHGIPFQNKGIIIQFEPEKLLQYTYWSTLSEQEDIPENYSLITIQLSPEDNNTNLHLTQSNFIAYTTFKHWEFYWNVTLYILKKFVENM
ncbi:MAG: SRPBCC domain-containing protein [Sphingobacteriales bacterium]|nr:MAG: SRPBCC domain-containing protein [Sphingobacteriales bacterium]